MSVSFPNKSRNRISFLVASSHRNVHDFIFQELHVMFLHFPDFIESVVTLLPLDQDVLLEINELVLRHFQTISFDYCRFRRFSLQPFGSQHWKWAKRWLVVSPSETQSTTWGCRLSLTHFPPHQRPSAVPGGLRRTQTRNNQTSAALMPHQASNSRFLWMRRADGFPVVAGIPGLVSLRLLRLRQSRHFWRRTGVPLRPGPNTQYPNGSRFLLFLFTAFHVHTMTLHFQSVELTFPSTKSFYALLLI